jgi:hypothetical protein
VGVEERYDPIIDQIRRRDWRLAIIQLGEANLGVGVDEGLLVDPADALQIADVECILGAAIASLSNSPWASFSVLAFSSAAS